MYFSSSVGHIHAVKVQTEAILSSTLLPAIFRMCLLEEKDY